MKCPARKLPLQSALFGVSIVIIELPAIRTHLLIQLMMFSTNLHFFERLL